MQPKLSLGMATYEDFDGVAFTLQSLRLTNDLTDVELIVVDNSPDTPMGRDTKNLVHGCQSGNRGARYIAMPEKTGTTQPRERIFHEARGDAVLVCDPHILLRPGTINRLLAWYDAHPDCRDLLSGPLLYDGLDQLSTQFDPVWRGEMWGIWGSDPRAEDENGEPFEIWAQGLGLFSARRDAWLGFNPHFRGFGGEEGYIHEKYRQAGRRALCLPWLRWWHRFGRPAGVKYPLTRWNKVRNYVLGHNELGLPLDPIHEHFVKSGLMGQADWDLLVADPTRSGEPEGVSPRTGGMIRGLTPAGSPGVDDIFAAAVAAPRDLNQHLPKLRELAATCERVTEFSHRAESLIAFAAGRPKSLVSHNRERHFPAVRALLPLCPFVQVDDRAADDVDAIADTDLLFLKTRQSGAQLAKELQKFAASVRRYIVLHDTTTHIEFAPDGTPGYAAALRPFVAEQPEWFVAYHAPEQYGLTVLSRNPFDRPAEPIVPWPLVAGPGTELAQLLSEIGIHPTASCGCKALARDMDRLGAEGCRANIDQLVAAIEKNQSGWGWKDKLSAAFKVAAAGYFSIRSLVEEAIRRAEA